MRSSRYDSGHEGAINMQGVREQGKSPSSPGKRVVLLSLREEQADYVHMGAATIDTNTRSCQPAHWKGEILSFPTVYGMPI